MISSGLLRCQLCSKGGIGAGSAPGPAIVQIDSQVLYCRITMGGGDMGSYSVQCLKLNLEGRQNRSRACAGQEALLNTFHKAILLLIVQRRRYP